MGKAILAQQDLLKSQNISRIRIISRDEIKQDELEKTYQGEIEIQCILGDVRDGPRMEMALSGCDYLIHAAALKIVPKIEYDVSEALRTNVQGTENVLKAFLKNKNALSGLFVSTDKAADPLNAYGFSKATAERLWLWGMMFQNKTKLSVCRYGNVFASRGSIIPVWSKALANNEKLKITSKEMTRFFIRLPDAAEFVLNRLFDNTGGQIRIPRMKATKLTDLGEAMALEDGKPLEWQTIGIREGEKIHEVLTSINDKTVAVTNEGIALHPLTDSVACYKDSRFRAFTILSKPMSSDTAPTLTTQELREYYKEYKNAHCRL